MTAFRQPRNSILGIFFLAMSSNDTRERTKELVSEGYQGMTTYHGFQLAWQRARSDRFPFASLLDTCPEVWRAADACSSGLLYLPIVDTGWDARPWHGDKSLVAEGRTPELFGKLCREARQYADATGKRIIALGPMNEWGEGSYIEPYAEYGFQDLDQLREAFCEPGDWPPNLVPADVGLGPYDLPQVAAKTDWDFSTDGALEGWTANGDVADLRPDSWAVARPDGSPVQRPVALSTLSADAVELGRFRLDQGPHKLQLDISPDGGVDVLVVEKRKSSPADYMELVGLHGDPAAAVSLAEAEKVLTSLVERFKGRK